MTARIKLFPPARTGFDFKQFRMGLRFTKGH